jgi:hypothetical protein
MQKASAHAPDQEQNGIATYDDFLNEYRRLQKA